MRRHRQDTTKDRILMVPIIQCQRRYVGYINRIPKTSHVDQILPLVDDHRASKTTPHKKKKHDLHTISTKWSIQSMDISAANPGAKRSTSRKNVITSDINHILSHEEHCSIKYNSWYISFRRYSFTAQKLRMTQGNLDMRTVYCILILVNYCRLSGFFFIASVKAHLWTEAIISVARSSHNSRR